MHTWNKLAALSGLGLIGSLAVWIGTSLAEESSVLVEKPAAATELQGPILPPPSNPNDKRVPSETVEMLPTPPQAAQPMPPQASQPTTPGTKRPFLRPAMPRGPAKGSLVVTEEPMPGPPATGPVVIGPPAPSIAGEEIQIRPTPPIDYDTDKDARRMYRSGKIDLIMLTTDPTDGCTYEIPMCIPACCVGDPKVASRRGILGRGVVEYRWECGFRAIVKFRHVLGDVEVEYEGD